MCGGIGGGFVKISIDFSMPYVVTIGAGEIAITPATGTRAATLIAIAPPIECPASTNRFASTAPRPIICFTNESPQLSARSNENGPCVLPCPGKSGTNTRSPCNANPLRDERHDLLIRRQPVKQNHVPLRVILARIDNIRHQPAPARIHDDRRLSKQRRPRQQKSHRAQQDRRHRPHPASLLGRLRSRSVADSFNSLSRRPLFRAKFTCVIN